MSDAFTGSLTTIMLLGFHGYILLLVPPPRTRDQPCHRPEHHRYDDAPCLVLGIYGRERFEWIRSRSRLTKRGKSLRTVRIGRHRDQPRSASARVSSGRREWRPKRRSGYSGRSSGTSVRRNWGYNGSVELRDVSFHALCKCHMTPIRGKAHIAYLQIGRVLRISRLARVVDPCARRLKVQERLTDDIATAVKTALHPS
jgi:hypothetical protein